jgi:hypothetical protein
VGQPHLLRDYVRHAGSRPLVRAFNALVADVWAFRAIHVVFADLYIARFTDKETATGGTPYRAYLSKHRDEAAAQQIADGPGGTADLVPVSTAGAGLWAAPSTAEYEKDIAAVLGGAESGIPAHLFARHRDIIERHGRTGGPEGELDPSLVRKSFPGKEWAEAGRG